jgi:hypothetical protein
MKSIRWLVALCALVLLAPLAPASAQTVAAITVSSCGTPPGTPVAGVSNWLTQDTTGKLCTSATGGGGSSYTVTGGAAGGLANLYTPAGGSDGTTYRMFKLDSSGDLNVVVPASGFASGAGVDGWDLTQGAKADTACATDNGTCSLAALIKRTNQDLTTLNTTAGGAIPAGSAIIGKVGIDQTTPGTTNGTQDAATSATGSAVSSKAIYAGAVSSGNLTGIIQADASAAISVSTATTTQIVALSSSKKIYVSSFDVIAGGTGNITFVYGTGSNCGTGTTSLTGAYNLTAQAGIAKGNGLGAVLVVPASNALCVTTSAAVQMSGSIAYTQF